MAQPPASPGLFESWQHTLISLTAMWDTETRGWSRARAAYGPAAAIDGLLGYL
jgi:hypothetical protein